MVEEQKAEKVDVVPDEGPPLILLEREAKNLIKELHSITSAGISAFKLPATTTLNRSGNFYVDEVIKTLKEYNIIE